MWGLLTRAWVFSCMITPSRLYGMLTMTIPWFEMQQLCDSGQFTKCYRPYNENVLDATADFARIIVQVLTVTNVILCLFCYRWRSMAQAFIYIEIFI